MPSCVYYHDEEVVVGSGAITQSKNNLNSTVLHPKHYIDHRSCGSTEVEKVDVVWVNMDVWIAFRSIPRPTRQFSFIFPVEATPKSFPSNKLSANCLPPSISLLSSQFRTLSHEPSSRVYRRFSPRLLVSDDFGKENYVYLEKAASIASIDSTYTPPKR